MNPYRDMEIRTASPLELVVRLYEAAIAHVQRSIEHQAAGRVKARGDAIAKALAIVSELRNSLDLKQGQAIAANLDSVYAYAIDRMLEANLRRDAEGLDEVVRILETLLEGWSELAHPTAQGKSAP